jgi:hypothetical protein
MAIHLRGEGCNVDTRQGLGPGLEAVGLRGNLPEDLGEGHVRETLDSVRSG